MGFSNTLKELLSEYGISQARLAASIGFSQRAVSKWINAQAEPTETAIAACANYFDVSADYLLGRDPNDWNTVNVPLQRLDLTQEETELVEDYRSLSPALQEMLRATIETWKGSKANVSKSRITKR